MARRDLNAAEVTRSCPPVLRRFYLRGAFCGNLSRQNDGGG
jgi:hypothetical protein